MSALTLFKRHNFVYFLTIKRFKYTILVLFFLFLSKALRYYTFLSDIACFFPVKWSVKGIRRIIARVSTFRVIVLYSLVVQMNTMYIPKQLWFGFVLSKSKWLEHVHVNGVSQKWQWKGQKSEFYKLHFSSKETITKAIHSNENVNQFLVDFGNVHANFKKSRLASITKIFFLASNYCDLICWIF